MIPDSKVDVSGAPVIVLGGREYFVPLLTMRQNRRVVPALLHLLPKLQQVEIGVASGAAIDALASIDADDYQQALNAIYAALTRAYPHLSEDHFLDLNMSFSELIEAVKIIIVQCGLFIPAGREMPQPGEEMGA